MDRALHPTQSKSISITGYMQEFGVKDIGGSCSLPARCLICKMDMRVSLPADRSKYFYHAQQETGCPTIKPNKVPYSNLPNPGNDYGNYEIGARFIRENWLGIYKRFKEILPATEWNEFIITLREASRRRILFYQHLDVARLPYFLVALGNFTKKTGITTGSYKRKFNFRFYFQQGPREDGLWITRLEPMPLFRMTYEGARILNVRETEIEQTAVEINVTPEMALKDFELDKVSARQLQIEQMFPLND